MSEKASTEQFREGRFSYRVLTPEFRDGALMCLSRAFCTEPVCSAIAEIKPEMKTHLHEWVEFVEYWMDHCSTNGLSIVAIDTLNGQVAGTFIVRDLLMIPPGFDEKYSSDSKTLTPWMQFLWHMDAEATKKMPELGEAGKAVDLWFLGVHPDYRGNKIANYLMKGVLPLCRNAGFKYATIEATSAFTSKAAKWNNFTAVHEQGAKDWLWKGEPLYTNAKAPHGTWTFWVKDLNEQFREGRFSYRVLTPEFRDGALMCLSRAFCTEPVCSAIAEIKPEMKTHLHDWVEFVEYWMDHCSTNGLSIVAIDTLNGQVAGTFIVRDLLMIPPGFDEKYSSDSKTLTPWMQFLWHMDAEATKKMPELGEAGKAVDLWFLGVHPDYRGNKIANYLMKGVLPLCRNAGFKYATIEATSAFTSKAAKWNNFTAVHEQEAKDWQWKGEPLYTNAKAPHGTWTFWVKDLQSEE